LLPGALGPDCILRDAARKKLKIRDSDTVGQVRISQRDNNARLSEFVRSKLRKHSFYLEFILDFLGIGKVLTVVTSVSCAHSIFKQNLRSAISANVSCPNTFAIGARNVENKAVTY
jgi:hypothetical protein